MISEKLKENTSVNSVKTGEFLAALRKAAGYTQQEVADYLNLTNKTISKWESGNGLPEIGILPTVAALYGVTVDELLAGRRLEKQESTDSSSKKRIEHHTKWLMTVSDRLYSTVLIILWVSAAAGLTLFWGLHYGLTERFRWVLIIYSVIWFLAEVLGAVLCFRSLFYKYASISTECPDLEQKCNKVMFRQGMGLLFPILFFVLSLLPYAFIKKLAAPLIDIIPASNDLLHFSGTADSTLVPIRFTWTGYFVYTLPVTALLASFVWGALYFLLQKITLKENTARYGIALLLAGILFFAGFHFAGQQYENNNSRKATVYKQEDDFQTYTETYLHLYESYRAYGELNGTTTWPDVTTDGKVIDSTWLDNALKGEHPEYQRVIGIDADKLTIYKKAAWEDLIATHARLNSYRAIACSAALIVLWWWFSRTRKKIAPL